MAALDFPPNPTNGQTFTSGGVSYYYNSAIGSWLTSYVATPLSVSSNTQIIFNDAGTANGSSGLVYLKGSGNLGVGTASPADKLEVVGSGSDGIRVSRSGVSSQYATLSSGSLGPTLQASSGVGALTLGNNGNIQAYLDSSGNLGLGVTPSAWAATRKVLQIGGNLALWGQSSGTGFIFLTNNAYFDGAWKYLNTGAASYYTQASDGAHTFYQAASGTAGNGITFTNAMTLDASGNLGINTTPATKLDINGPASVTSFTGTTKLGVVTRGSTGATDYSGIDFIGNNQTNPLARIAVLSTGGGSYLSFGTSSNYASGITNQAITIDYNGNVGIGNTSPAFKLDVTSSSSSVAHFYCSAGRGLVKTDGSTDSSFQMCRNGSIIGWIQSDTSGTEVNLGTLGAWPLNFYTNNTYRMGIDSSGNFIVGQGGTFNFSSNGIQLQPQGRINISSSTDWLMEMGGATTQRVRFYTSAGGTGTTVGSIQVSTSATTYATSSDYRLKKNVRPMTDALQKISQLNPVLFDWKIDDKPGQGFIAHELQQVFPEAVSGEKDAVDKDGNINPQGVDASFLVATLVKAIQELKAEFDAYKASRP